MAIVATAMKIPVDPRTVPIREREPGQTSPLTEMLSSRPIVICLVLIFTVDFISTMLEPTLSIHLYEMFQMDAWERGMLFAEAGFFGVLCAPLASILGECGRGPLHRKMLVLIGLFC